MCLKVAEFYFGVNLQKDTAGVVWANPWKDLPPSLKNF